MKAVIQRVLNASVSVEGQIVSSIGLGLCILIGIHRNDTEADVDFMVPKLLKMRIYDDPTTGRTSVMEKGYEVLCLSQITLYHSIKGNRIDFHTAMVPKLSIKLFNNFIQKMKWFYEEGKIKQGRFGVDSVISLQNDGPYTIVFESKPKKSKT